MTSIPRRSLFRLSAMPAQVDGLPKKMAKVPGNTGLYKAETENPVCLPNICADALSIAIDNTVALFHAYVPRRAK